MEMDVSSSNNSTIKQEFNEELGNENGEISTKSDVLQDLKFEIEYESHPSKTDHKDEIFVCDFCGEFMHSQKALGDHELQCKIKCESVPSKSGTKDKELHIKDEIFLCEVCQESFRSEEDLEDHKLSHLGAEPEGDEDEAENAYVCSVCNDVFDSKKDLVEHKNSISECYEHRKCDKCGDGSAEEFSCIWELIDHVKDKHGLNVGGDHVEYNITEYLLGTNGMQNLDDCRAKPRKSEVEDFELKQEFPESLTDNDPIFQKSLDQMQIFAEEECEAEVSEVQEFLKSEAADIVDFVIKKQFQTFNHTDKVLLKSLEIPRPTMKNLQSSSPECKRSFPVIFYKKFDWLTGSVTRNQLFCWKCLLLCDNNENPWVCEGFGNLTELSKYLRKHELTKGHIHASLKFILFGKNIIPTNLNSACRENIRKFNEMVQDNRDTMKRLIDMSIYLATNKGNIQELAQFLSEFDDRFKKILDKSTFNFASEKFQNDLLSAINTVVNQRIDSELKQAVCFSWRVDLTSNIHLDPQLSIVVRYAFQGQVRERFLGFHDDTNDLFKLLINKFERVDMKGKLVGQCYDGGSVKTNKLDEFQKRIRSVAPQALLFHSGDHDLNLVLQDVTSDIKECALFFSGLYGISSLFSRKNCANLFDQFCGRNISGETSWDSGWMLINTVLANRDALIEAFGYILETKEFDRDEEAIRSASVLIEVLNDFEFLFFLNTFNLVFEQTAKSMETVCCVQKVLETLESFRTVFHYFDEIFESCTNILGPARKKRKTDSGKAHLRSIFHEILFLVTNQVRLRFQNVEKFTFFDLLDRTKFNQYKNTFPHHLLDILVDVYPSLFNKKKLETQLKVIYSDPDILGNATVPSSMLSFIHNNSLETVIWEVHKLLSVVLSLQAEQDFSTLKRIKSFVTNRMIQQDLSRHSVIAIEKQLVDDMANEATFYDNIIDHFADTTNYRIDLKFKALN